MANAVLMASGMGTRMRPLTLTTPKPLIQVNGVPMIETVINGLEKYNIEKIFIIVGYLGDQFEYLTKKYNNIELIRNNDYEAINNISSIYYAKDKLKLDDTYICEADLFLADDIILSERPEESCYFGKMVKGHSDDWVFETDNNGFITRVGKVGTDVYNMCGIAFFKKKEAIMISEAVEKRYNTEGFENLFWDDVVNENLDTIRLKVSPVSDNSIVEIDTVEELEIVNERVVGGYYES